MYKIEFNEETTLDGVFESFKNLKEAKIKCYIEINGEKFYDTDPNLKEKLIIAIKKAKRNKIKKIKLKENTSETDKELEKSTNKLTNLCSLSRNEVFKYYLNICLKYVKQEHREELINYYVKIYSDDKNIKLRDIHLFANIILILEYKDIVTIQEKLNLLFLNISQNDIEQLELTLINIEQLGINGHLIKECFDKNILSNAVEKAENEVLCLTKKQK